MRLIKIPSPFTMPLRPGAAKGDDYPWKMFCAEFVFHDVRWMGEEWRPAYDRLTPMATATPGASIEVSKDDWEKLCECVRAANERMNPLLRMDLIRMAHAITCAPVKPEPVETQAPS